MIIHSILVARLAFLSLLFSAVTSEPLAVTICVPHPEGSSPSFLQKCTDAVSDANTDELEFECVSGGSADECIDKLLRGSALLTALDGSDVLHAHDRHGIVPLVLENEGDDIPGGTYYAVAVVNEDFCTKSTTLADLKGVNSCHTGYRKTAGWRIPVGTLVSRVDDFLTKPELADVENDAELLSNFFGSVCAPRTSGLGPKHGSGGKGILWEPLCEGCKGNCTSNDQYYDYPGAFRCLMEGKGDVAFVRHSTVPDYAKDGNLDEIHRAWANKTQEEFRLLCPDGGCKSVAEFKDCHLALAPGHALVVRKHLGAGGDDEDTGLSIQSAIIKAATNSDFINKTKAIADNFLWTQGTTGLTRATRGIESYLPSQSREVFTAYDELEFRALNSGPPGGVYCATSDEEMDSCMKMMRIARRLVKDVEWGCEQRETKRECMEVIEHSLADWMTVGASDGYAAFNRHGLTSILADEGELGNGYDYYSIALVRRELCNQNEPAKLLDLRGRRSCHTGYRRNAGWDVPVGRMMELGIMKPVRKDLLIKNDAETVAAFFDKSCAPNRDGEGPRRLKNGTVVEWEPLCSLCTDSCDGDSPYAGYEGALRCLEDDTGDVAFVKHSTVFSYIDPSDRSDFRLLCPGTASCSSVDDYIKCNLGLVPARFIVVRPMPLYTETFKNAISELLKAEEFIEAVLTEENNPDGHIFRPDRPNFINLTKGTEAFYGESFSIYEELDKLDAPFGTILKVCIPYEASSSETQRCSDIFNAAKLNGIIFECVKGGSSDVCMEQIYRGEAHLTNLDGGDVFRGHHVYGLVPLLVEDTGTDVSGSYYAVAVVNADFCTDETTLASLKAVRSCHTGYRKMAGWRVPVGTLLEEVEIFSAPTNKTGIEDDAELVAKFFSGTCAPRVSGGGPQNTDDGNGALWDPLCTQCTGSCLQNDQYYDYPGALRCLMEGKGDVAFVRHTTVLEYAYDGSLDKVFRAWADKPASSFKLLCREGGCADVNDYRNCHLALVPSHAMVGSAAFGENGEFADVAKVLQEGLVKAVEIPKFFEDAKGFINDFPFASSAVGVDIVRDGYEGYITPDADRTLTLFSELIDGEKRSNQGNSATFCASTPEQYAACQHNVKQVLKKAEPGLEWDCVEEESTEACVESVRKGTAQFMAASVKEALEAYTEANLHAIVAEGIGENKDVHTHSLVVIKADTCYDQIFFSDLKNEDICFSGFGSLTGWETPIATMIGQGFLTKSSGGKPTNSAESAAEFFGKICAPHDPESDFAADKFCEACEDDCTLDSAFAGPLGAVECLTQKKGRAAVTDNTILLKKDLAKNLQLLCPNKRECHDIEKYESCSFGIAPTDVIMVDGEADSVFVSTLRATLVETSTSSRYISLLSNTRDSGELVAIAGDTKLHLARFVFTDEILSDFDET